MEIVTLKNGLKIIFDENMNMRSASVNIYIGCGSRYEPEKYSGVSHFIEHMLFKGTLHRTCADIAEQMDEIGGRLNAFTTKEYTCVYTQALSYHIETALEVVLDMLLYSSFEEADINTEKGVICEEIGMYEDSPEDVCFDLMCSCIWPGTALGRPIIGSRDTVNHLARNEIISFMRDYYTPDNTVVSVSGKFDRQRIYDIIQKFLGDALHSRHRDEHSVRPLLSESGADLGSKNIGNFAGSHNAGVLKLKELISKRPNKAFEPSAMADLKGKELLNSAEQPIAAAPSCSFTLGGDKNVLSHLPAAYATASFDDICPIFHSGISLYNHDFEQTNLIIAFPGLTVNDEAKYAAALMSSIAGASSSSRLNRRIREELGMAYSIYSFHTSHIGAGVFGVSAGVSDSNQGSVIKETLKILLSLKTGITESELNRAKQQLKASIAMSLESTSSRSSSFGQNLLIDGYVDSEDDVMSKIDAVTLEEVKLITNRIIDIKKVHIAVAGHTETKEFYNEIINDAYKYNY